MLPLGYLLRNLLRRRVRTVVTIGGVAATTLLVIAMNAFAGGMIRAAGASALADTVVLLNVSAEIDLVRSVVPRGTAEIAASSVPGVVSVDGQRAASIELHFATRNGDAVGLVRGVTPAAYLVHPQVTVVAGREPREPFEVMVGGLAGARLGVSAGELAIGNTLPIERRDFRIVGHFVAPDTIYEGEIWARLPDVMLATKREDVSCVVLRLADPKGLGDVRLFTSRRVDLELAAVPETELMANVTKSILPIAVLARWLAVLAVIAGAVACANTMFAAVLARTREFATLRAIGWSPAAIAVGLVQESVLVAFLGGGLGCLVALAFGDLSLRYPMGALSLHADQNSRALGLGAALSSGLLGGIVPAVRAVRLPLSEALGGRA